MQRKGLSDAGIRRLEVRDQVYRVAVGDGSGLIVEVAPSGSKLWRYRYTRPSGKPGMVSLGDCADVSLDDARVKLSDARRQLIEGRDPVIEKRAAALRARASAATTFGAIAEEFVQTRAVRWGERHTRAQQRRIEVDLADLRALPISQIDSPMVLAVLRKIEQRGALEIAAKARRIASEVFRFAIASGRAERDPAAPLVGVIQSRPAIMRAAVSLADVPAMFAAVARTPHESVTARALVFLFATATRSGETRGATWREISPDGHTWTIPAARMKMQRDHVIPLSGLAQAALGERGGDHEYVFPGFSKTGTLSENALNQCLTRSGYYKRQTAHGSRALFSTWAHEVAKADPDVIESCLAHVVAGVRGRYNRAQYLPQRRALMEHWAKWLTGAGLAALIP
jgi:integrase